IDLEVLAQLRARIRAPVPVRPEGHVAPGNPRANLLGYRTNVVGRGHDRPRAALETLAHVRYARGFLGVQEVAALAVDRLAAELAEARHRVHIRRYAEIALEQLRGRDALAQDRARAEQRRAHAPAAAAPQRIHSLENSLLNVLRHGRLRVVLVHAGDVVEDALLLHEHPPQAVVYDHRELISVGRIVCHAIRHGRRDKLAVTVLMLQ